MLGYYMGKGLIWKWPEPLGRGEGDRVQKQAVKGPRLTLRPTGGCVKEIGRVGVGRGITQKKAYKIQYTAKV